jgi:O-acetyl-ADP-ribose deacetylase (regulator of RNase III)
MVAQQGLRSYQNPIPLNYEALGKCLVQVAERAKSSGAIVCMPRIGCGLAGGSWDKVSAIIEDKLTGVEVHVYDLPTSSC